MLDHIKTFIFLKTKVQFSLNFDINFDKFINKLNILYIDIWIKLFILKNSFFFQVRHN